MFATDSEMKPTHTLAVDVIQNGQTYLAGTHGVVMYCAPYPPRLIVGNRLVSVSWDILKPI